MTGRRGPGRRASATELELWRSVTRFVRPLVPTPAVEPPSPVATFPVQAPEVAAPLPRATPKRETPLSELEPRLKRRLSRGQIEADDSLDLHGLRQEQAFETLFRFLRAAQDRGARVVIVVTGKGRAGADPGVLRRAVPLWLAAPAVRSLVIGFEEAAARHGGGGALYVRLRRRQTESRSY